MKDKPNSKLAYTIDEAAGLVGVSDKHLRKYINNGRLRSFNLGRSRRVSDASLNEFINTLENNSKENNNG